MSSKIVIIGTNDHIYSADTFTTAVVPTEVFFRVNWTDIGASGLQEVAFSNRHIFLVQSGQILCLSDYRGYYTSSGINIPTQWGKFPRHGGYYGDKPVTAISFDGYRAELAIIQDSTVIYADNIGNWTANWRTISGSGFSRVSVSNRQCVGLVGNQLYYNPNCADANWYKVNDSSDLTEISFDGYKMTLLCIRVNLIDVYYADKMNIIENADGTIGITPNWDRRYGTPDSIHTSKISHSNGRYIAIDKTNRIFYNSDAKAIKEAVTRIEGHGIRPSFDGYNGQLPSNEEYGFSDYYNSKTDNTNYPHYDGNPNFEFKGCWKGYQPGNWRSLYRSSAEGNMTAKECRDEAIRNKVRFFSLQNGGNCYLEKDNLQNFNEDFDYGRYGAGFTSLCSSSKDGALKDTYRYGYIRADNVYRAVTAQEQNRHEENSSSVDYNTQSDNLNYPNKDTSLPNQYNYRGCWAGDYTDFEFLKWSVNTAKQCRDLAYSNGNSNFAIGEIEGFKYCLGSNTAAYNTNAKGFTNQCQNLFGGDNTDQVYELKFTKADEKIAYDKLKVIHDTVVANNTSIDTNLTTITTIYSNINGNGGRVDSNGIMQRSTNGTGYLNQAFTGLSFAQGTNIPNAETNSTSAFNLSASALQKAESARRLAQDLTKQEAASTKAQESIDDSTNSDASSDNANKDIVSANANYKIVIDRASTSIASAANIDTIKSNSESLLKGSIDMYDDFYTTYYNAKSFVTSVRIVTKITVIKSYIGKSKNSTVPSDLTENTPIGISKSIVSDIIARRSDIIGFLDKFAEYTAIANNQTTRDNIKSIIRQSQEAASIAYTNASSVKASTRAELNRIANNKIIEDNQQKLLAAADEKEKQRIQVEIDEANARKAQLNLDKSIERAEKEKIAYDRSLVQINTINKQKQLMNNLNKNIISINNATTIEGFVNPLPTNKNEELNDYVSSFNNGLALLDDPNQMTKVAFDAYLHIQDTKLAKLNEDLQDLKERASTSNASPFKSIRSMKNSSILNLESYPDKDTTKNNPKYLIYGNNGCLQYENKYEEEPNTWNFKPCDANKAKQHFKINQINTLNQYNDPITSKNNEKYKIKNESNTKLGFYTVNPIDDSDQCLQLNNDGVSVMPCNMDSSQRFSANQHTVL